MYKAVVCIDETFCSTGYYLETIPDSHNHPNYVLQASASQYSSEKTCRFSEEAQYDSMILWRIIENTTKLLPTFDFRGIGRPSFLIWPPVSPLPSSLSLDREGHTNDSPHISAVEKWSWMSVFGHSKEIYGSNELNDYP